MDVYKEFEFEQEELDPRFLDTEFVIEAGSFSKMELWAQYTDKYGNVEWEQDCSGCMLTLGEFGGLPVVVCFFWSTVDGHLLMFYEATSLVVHHGMVESFLKKHCSPRTKENRNAHVDAMNFHNCVGPLKGGKLLSFRETLKLKEME